MSRVEKQSIAFKNTSKSWLWAFKSPRWVFPLPINTAATTTTIRFPRTWGAWQLIAGVWKITIRHPCRQKTVCERGVRCVIQCHSTCILRPSEDGGNLVALCGVTLGTDSSCAHSNRALVGLDPAEVRCGSAGAVWHLSVSVVCLQNYRSLTCGQH